MQQGLAGAFTSSGECRMIPLEAQIYAAIDAWFNRHPHLSAVLGVGGLWLIIFLFFAAIAFGR